MVYCIMSVYIVSYMATMWYVMGNDKPSNYKTVKEYMKSKYYLFITFLTSTVNGGLVVLYLYSEDWRYPLAAFIAICINNFLIVRIKKPHTK